jgi:ubiquinone/menaquinone biosynthesis C-methylase UbiE
VLDLACGTGVVARRAGERLGTGAKVVGIDLNPQMLAVARRVAPNVEWREGDATSLPLDANEKFDVVLCQQGFQLFADRDAAARQMHGALAEGGRLGVSTWLPDEGFQVLLELRRVAESHVGGIADRRHSLGDPSPIEAALSRAGFRDVRARRYVRTIHFRDGVSFLRLNAAALVSMSEFRTQSDEERQRMVGLIVHDSKERLSGALSGGELAYELGTNVVLATA